MHTISKDGTRIAFEKTGNGPAVILVNGAMQYRAIDPVMAKLAELLSKSFTIYNYDRRGRGESKATQPFSKKREIEDIAALIGEAGGAAMVFGISSGGGLALEAAEEGLNISKVAVYEIPFIVNGSRPPLPRNYVEHLKALIKDGKRADAIKYFMVEAAGIPAEYLGGMEQNPMWPQMLEIAHTISNDGSFVADKMQGKPLPEDYLKNVAIPVLVVDGEKSLPGWMSSGADAIAAKLQHAERRTLEGQDHMVDPAVLAPELERFFLG